MAGAHFQQRLNEFYGRDIEQKYVRQKNLLAIIAAGLILLGLVITTDWAILLLLVLLVVSAWLAGWWYVIKLH